MGINRFTISIHQISPVFLCLLIPLCVTHWDLYLMGCLLGTPPFHPHPQDIHSPVLSCVSLPSHSSLCHTLRSLPHGLSPWYTPLPPSPPGHPLTSSLLCFFAFSFLSVSYTEISSSWAVSSLHHPQDHHSPILSCISLPSHSSLYVTLRSLVPGLSHSYTTPTLRITTHQFSPFFVFSFLSVSCIEISTSWAVSSLHPPTPRITITSSLLCFFVFSFLSVSYTDISSS